MRLSPSYPPSAGSPVTVWMRLRQQFMKSLELECLGHIFTGWSKGESQQL